MRSATGVGVGYRVATIAQRRAAVPGAQMKRSHTAGAAFSAN
jgi:hypothetical protein